MGEKCRGEKSSGYSGGFHHKNAPSQGFQSNIAELKDDIFTINPNQGGVAKFEKSSEAISNYVVQNYDSGIMLAKGIGEGKLPVVILDPAIRRKKRKKKKRKWKKKKKK